MKRRSTAHSHVCTCRSQYSNLPNFPYRTSRPLTQMGNTLQNIPFPNKGAALIHAKDETRSHSCYSVSIHLIKTCMACNQALVHVHVSSAMQHPMHHTSGRQAQGIFFCLPHGSTEESTTPASPLPSSSSSSRELLVGFLSLQRSNN